MDRILSSRKYEALRSWMEIFSRTNRFIISLIVFYGNLFCSTEEICSSILMFFLFDISILIFLFLIILPFAFSFTFQFRFSIWCQICKYQSSIIYHSYNIRFWPIKILRLFRLRHVSNRLSSSSRSKGRTFQMHSRITWNLVIWKLASFMLIISLLSHVKINETW